MSELERQLEQKCMRLVRKYGGQHRKLDVGAGAKGWLDRAVWMPNGFHVIVEFKVGTNTPSKKQYEKIWELRQGHHTVWLVRSYVEFCRLMSRETRKDYA